MVLLSVVFKGAAHKHTHTHTPQNTHGHTHTHHRTHTHPYLSGGDAVDEADLLEALFTESQAHLPALVNRLVYHLQGHAGLVQLVLHVQVHVAAEPSHLGSPGEQGLTWVL